jgi:hypothetical protein
MLIAAFRVKERFSASTRHRQRLLSRRQAVGAVGTALQSRDLGAALEIECRGSILGWDLLQFAWRQFSSDCLECSRAWFSSRSVLSLRSRLRPRCVTETDESPTRMVLIHWPAPRAHMIRRSQRWLSRCAACEIRVR